jgi:hypothetical protein
MENDVTTQNIQQYVRVTLYYIFGALATYGVQVPDNKKTLILSVVGVMANLAWTVYGTRLNGLLEQIKEKSGVDSIEVKVNPDVINPTALNQNTSSGIVAKAS